MSKDMKFSGKVDEIVFNTKEGETFKVIAKCKGMIRTKVDKIDGGVHEVPINFIIQGSDRSTVAALLMVEEQDLNGYIEMEGTLKFARVDGHLGDYDEQKKLTVEVEGEDPKPEEEPSILD